MDKERFLETARRGSTTLDDLLSMRRNAIVRNHIEYVNLAERVLDERFPTWRKVISKPGGKTPTDVRFLDKKASFDTAKDAYVWMVERFIQHRPALFDHPDADTRFVAMGPGTRYFARSRAKLFEANPELEENPGMSCQLSNGWFAKLNLSNKQKLDVLGRIGSVCQLREETDWSFHTSRGQGTNPFEDPLDDLP